MNVEVRKPTPEELDKWGVKSWPIWEKEESSFDWYYDEKEMCFFLEGEVEVELTTGEKVKIEKGDWAVLSRRSGWFDSCRLYLGEDNSLSESYMRR